MTFSEMFSYTFVIWGIQRYASPVSKQQLFYFCFQHSSPSEGFKQQANNCSCSFILFYLVATGGPPARLWITPSGQKLYVATCLGMPALSVGVSLIFGWFLHCCQQSSLSVRAFKWLFSHLHRWSVQVHCALMVGQEQHSQYGLFVDSTHHYDLSSP